MKRLSKILLVVFALQGCDNVEPIVDDGIGDTDSAEMRRIARSRKKPGKTIDTGTTDAGTVTPTPTPTPTPDPTPDPTPTPPPTGGLAQGWLTTQGNQILISDGLGGTTPFKGKGANVHDTRSCWACAYGPPNVAEVTRRIDVLVDQWGANFIRLDMEAYTDDPNELFGKSVVADPAYLADIETIVRHATGKGVYVLLSLWHDPSTSSQGWPTATTSSRWAMIAERFLDEPRVLFGIVNEPTYNYDGALDQAVWNSMNDVRAAIRAVEDAQGAPHHVIVAQGTGGWARLADYYVDHPLPGDNVAYEVHIYNPQGDFANLLAPASTIPLIIGEFGPVAGTMTLDDTDVLITQAKQKGVSFLAWTFHQNCAPNLLVDNSGGGCGVGMALQPSTWGQRFKARLAEAW